MIPPCDRVFDGEVCGERGQHLCEPRAKHVQAFFAEVLVHTKGKYDKKPFILADWQYADIVRPLFGRVIWSDENDCYVRQYRRAWIEIARKNGKSEILAGFMLYLLVASGEASGELFGCARVREQAAVVFEVAAEMVRKAPLLSKRVEIVNYNRQAVDPKTHSIYKVISADGKAALGTNPSGVAADEILAWPKRELWDALETGMGSGARLEPLMIAATTAGFTDSGFAEDMHKTMVGIDAEPDSSRHTFTYIRNTPDNADPWAENTWRIANPALGTFLSLESFRQAAEDAKVDPNAEQAFRQYRLNQWTKGTFRWMDMVRYDAANARSCPNDSVIESLSGRTCFAGMDLAAKMDLTSICYLFPDEEGASACWRFYAPQEAVDLLDAHNDGKLSRWAADGWLTVHDGSMVDFDKIVEDVKADGARFKCLGLDADSWGGFPQISATAKALGLNPEQNVMTYQNTYTMMSPGLDHLTALVKSANFQHFGNPLARWCFESTEVRRSPINPDLVRPDKPQRDKVWRRIDGVSAAAMAANCRQRVGDTVRRVSVYETRGIVVA